MVLIPIFSLAGVACDGLNINLPPVPPPPLPDNLTKTSYSGRAAVVMGTVLGQTVAFSDTGALLSVGGSLESSVLAINRPDFLTGEVTHAYAVAGYQKTRTASALAYLDLKIGEHRISADFFLARAMADCNGETASVRGDLQFANLAIDGQPIQTPIAPNQEVALLDITGQRVGRVILNEQIQTQNGANAEITVNGLHIELANVADLVLFHANAGIRCGTGEPDGDFLTGGCWIGTPSGGRANVSVAGGLTITSSLWGHLNFVDRDADLHAHGTGVTAYTVLDAKTRRIEGTAEINGQAGFTYTVEATDNGEPGGGDICLIRFSNGYQASGNLNGGNIELHNLTVSAGP